ncbi:MAG: hypothetical protein IJU75_01495 [Clostridia bacterium]|nr:hypothetical protein [Clostridia bacterium]
MTVWEAIRSTLLQSLWMWLNINMIPALTAIAFKVSDTYLYKKLSGGGFRKSGSVITVSVVLSVVISLIGPALFFPAIGYFFIAGGHPRAWAVVCLLIAPVFAIFGLPGMLGALSEYDRHAHKKSGIDVPREVVRSVTRGNVLLIILPVLFPLFGIVASIFRGEGLGGALWTVALILSVIISAVACVIKLLLNRKLVKKYGSENPVKEPPTME